MGIYGRPDMKNPVDRLAHLLSEIHNDQAPIGWERYRPMARTLIRKLPILDTIQREDFLHHDFYAGEVPD